MNRSKAVRLVGLSGTLLGALAAALAEYYSTTAGLVGAALADMSTSPPAQETT